MEVVNTLILENPITPKGFVKTQISREQSRGQQLLSDKIYPIVTYYTPGFTFLNNKLYIVGATLKNTTPIKIYSNYEMYLFWISNYKVKKSKPVV